MIYLKEGSLSGCPLFFTYTRVKAAGAVIGIFSFASGKSIFLFRVFTKY